MPSSGSGSQSYSYQTRMYTSGGGSSSRGKKDKDEEQQRQAQQPEQPPSQPQCADQVSDSGSLERERPPLEEDQRHHDAERYGFQTDGGDRDRPLTKITGARMQYQQPANGGPNQTLQYSPAQLNGTGVAERGSPGEELGNGPTQRAGAQTPVPEPQKALQRTNSMQQLEQWVRSQRGRGQDDDTRR